MRRSRSTDEASRWQSDESCCSHDSLGQDRTNPNPDRISRGLAAPPRLPSRGPSIVRHPSLPDFFQDKMSAPRMPTRGKPVSNSPPRTPRLSNSFDGGGEVVAAEAMLKGGSCWDVSCSPPQPPRQSNSDDEGNMAAGDPMLLSSFWEWYIAMDGDSRELQKPTQKPMIKGDGPRSFRPPMVKSFVAASERCECSDSLDDCQKSCPTAA